MTAKKTPTPTEAPAAAARKVPCPTCGKPSVFAPQNPWRPFCSERCRSVDLGAWASESYRVAEQSTPADEDPGERH